MHLKPMLFSGHAQATVLTLTMGRGGMEYEPFNSNVNARTFNAGETIFAVKVMSFDEIWST